MVRITMIAIATTATAPVPIADRCDSNALHDLKWSYVINSFVRTQLERGRRKWTSAAM